MVTRELFDSICAQIASGDSVRKACAEFGIKRTTFTDSIRMGSDEEKAYRSDHYARAMEEGAENDAEKLRDMMCETPPVVEGRIDSGWVAWQRLRWDDARWNLSKKLPKKYGDKVELQHSGEVKVKAVPDFSERPE